MQSLMELVAYVVANWQIVLTSFAGVLIALIAFFKLLVAIFVYIPGEQPEKFLQSCVDLLQKYVDWITSVSKK